MACDITSGSFCPALDTKYPLDTASYPPRPGASLRPAAAGLSVPCAGPHVVATSYADKRAARYWRRAAAYADTCATHAVGTAASDRT
jgi:hypothetical protein